MSHRMTSSHTGAGVIIATLLLAASGLAQEQTSAPPPTNDAILHQMQELQEEVKALRAEVTALKAAPAAAAAPAPAAPEAAAAPATAAPAGATSAPAATLASTGLAGLLGPTTLSGFVDTYYGYNANQPAGRQNGLRNFDVNSGQFGLNMLELIADKAVDNTNRVGYHVSLGFGQAMNLVNSTEVGPGAVPGTSTSNFDQYLKEGYIEWMAPVGKGLQINVGKFVTPNGAEVIESKDNWNYSRSLLFAWAIPYFHFGASAKYAFGPKFALTGYLVNGWNNSIDNNTGKTGGASVAWTPNAKFSLVENWMGGPEHLNYNGAFRNLFDTVITYNPTAKLSLMANYDYGRDHIVNSEFPGVPPFTVGPHAVWSGLAGYVKYAPNDKYAFSLRGEYFDDNQGFATGIGGAGQELSEFTATFQRMIAKSIITRLEFRRDMSDTAVFARGNFGDPNVKTQNTVTLGVVYAFSSADAGK
jgi:hypothetical protein